MATSYLTHKVLGFSVFGGKRGRLNLLWQAHIKGIGMRTIYQNSKGRYVTIKGKRYFFKKDHGVYNAMLYSEFKKGQ